MIIKISVRTQDSTIGFRVEVPKEPEDEKAIKLAEGAKEALLILGKALIDVGGAA